MGKHSSKGGTPFGRKHESLGHTGREPRPLRSLDRDGSGPKKRTPRPAEGQRLTDPSSRRRGPLESAPARLKAERERRRSRYRKVALFAVVTIAVLLALGAVGAYAYVRHLESTMQVTRTTKLDASLAQAKPQKPYTVLILGGDQRKGDEVYRSDTMILAKIDPKTKQMWLMSIPRDTRVEIPGHGAKKINQAYQYGGAEGAIDAVHDLTGVPINHYMQVNFYGFKKAVNALGGVWIDVPVEINDRSAASASRKKAASHIDAGYQLLDGEHALTFVRARHQFVDQDFSRMKNQQLFFRALADQVAKKENVSKLPRVVMAVAPYIKTDMSLMEMVRTAQAMRGAGGKSLYTATVVGEWRSPFIYTDEKKLDELVKKMKAGVSFDATSTTAPGSKPTAGTQTSSAPAEEVDPKDVSVTVRNGGGVAGCAKQASSILKARAFNVADVGNAGQFVYDQTLVVHKNSPAAAALVAKALPPGTKIVESRGMYTFGTDVLVVIGKDWDLARVPVTPVDASQ